MGMQLWSITTQQDKNMYYIYQDATLNTQCCIYDSLMYNVYHLTICVQYALLITALPCWYPMISNSPGPTNHPDKDIW